MTPAFEFIGTVLTDRRAHRPTNAILAPWSTSGVAIPLVASALGLLLVMAPVHRTQVVLHLSLFVAGVAAMLLSIRSYGQRSSFVG